MSSSIQPAARHFRLDLLRACAIGLVFLFHYPTFVNREPSLGTWFEGGWLGVDLFFVLSGFLIADQLLKGAGRDRTLRWRSFWWRRAWRTWPLFFLVLAAFLAWPAWLGGKAPPPWWRFATFTQNILLQPGTAFSHAWSLCIEEQFYAVLPIVFSGAWWLVRRGWVSARRLMIVGVVATSALGLGVRWWLWLAYGTIVPGQESSFGRDFYAHFYYASWCRFDEFVPGIAVAWLHRREPVAWSWLRERAGVLALVAALLAAWGVDEAGARFFVEGVGTPFHVHVLGLTVMPWLFAALLPWALTGPQHDLSRPIRDTGFWGALAWAARAMVHRVAVWSYALYLIHKPLGHLLSRHVWPQGASPWGLLALTVALSLAISWLLCRVVERPFMAWRDRHAQPLWRKRPGEALDGLPLRPQALAGD